jgi:hypothetical protein
MRTRNDLAGGLTPDSRIAELEHGLDAAQHLLYEIVMGAFRRGQRRDPATAAEYRAYRCRLYEAACTAMATRTE